MATDDMIIRSFHTALKQSVLSGTVGGKDLAPPDIHTAAGQRVGVGVGVGVGVRDGVGVGVWGFRLVRARSVV